MPSESIEIWLKSKRFARIESHVLQPRENLQMRDTPLSVSRGQAETFFLEDKDGKKWILKKFHSNKCPNAAYLNGICRILPNNAAFRCGTDRKVLLKSSLKNESGYYYSVDLASELENCILMPHIPGLDWLAVAERIRNRDIILNQTQRKLLCRNLAEAVKLLERNSISHRDLSGGNVFVAPASSSVSFIDFDSVYHHSLPLPAFTTAGSEGYTAPFVDLANIRSSYCTYADRFALSILCVEFLVLSPNSPFCHEGGLFEQKDINRRYGKTINYARTQLTKRYPEVLKLFNAAINSRSFKHCPSPDSWIGFCKNMGMQLSINSIPQVTFKKSNTKSVVFVNLPQDPWKTKGEQSHGNNSQFNHRNMPSAAGGNRFANHRNHAKAHL